jgi:uncharacterized protein (DUF2147 family)
MKRLCILLVLLVTASSAQADSISFSVAGHRIRVDAPRNCRSTSCASISIPGVYESRRKRWDDEDRDVVVAPPPPPSAAPAPVQQTPPPAPIPSPVQQMTPPAAPAVVATPAPASRLTVVMVPAPTPLAIYKPAAATTQEVAPPPPPAAQAPVIKPVDVKPAAPLLNVLREDDPDSPIGDWQTENKGLVRIAECGRALCGYAIKPGDDAKGEAVLINMKPKTSVQWAGSVYSKDSGDTYYGSINLKGPNTLRVEACAIGRFYCNGNHWTRMPPMTDRIITSRQVDQQPRT